MSREVFMRELEYLLQDIPEEDRNDALMYYTDYFEEAGTDHEEDVLQEFGSPERVASMIRSDLSGSLEQGGEFTENGFQDERFKDPNFQMVEHRDLPESSSYGKERDTKGKSGQGSSGYSNRILKWILFGFLCIFASPFILGLGGILLGALGALFGIVVGLAAVIGALTLGVLLSAIVFLVFGMINIAINPLNGILIFGISLLLFGVGFLCLCVALLFYGRFLPWLLRSVLDYFSRLFHSIRRKKA